MSLTTGSGLNQIKVEDDIEGRKLDVLDQLLDIFKDVVEDEHLHVIVQRRTSTCNCFSTTRVAVFALLRRMPT